MKVTVCELNNDFKGLDHDWKRLVEHVRAERSDLVLLPEMAFHPWLAASDHPDPAQWQAAVEAHEHWRSRLHELLPAEVIAGTRPVVQGIRRHNEAFLWERSGGYRAAHHKYYLPDEPEFWEATWYDRGECSFEPLRTGDVQVGFTICTEIWFFQHARVYGQQGIDLLLCPRATPAGSTEKWITGGRTAAVVSGAYCLSSNLSGKVNGVAMGGAGWVIEPEQGTILGVTSREHPFLTISIDPAAARAAKRTYPRYVLD